MQSHRQKLDVENLARSIRQSNFGWAACRSWEITGCPNLDSPSKVAIHDALPLRYVTVIHRGPPWNPESHRDNLPRLAATCGRLPQLAADCSRLRQNPDSAKGRNCGRTARRIENYTQKAPHSRSHAGWSLFGLLRHIGQDSQREPDKQKQDKQHCGTSSKLLYQVAAAVSTPNCIAKASAAVCTFAVRHGQYIRS